MNNIPNKNIRTIILLLIMVIFLVTSIYVGITKENNKLLGKSLVELYFSEMFDYDDHYYDDNYEDNYYDNYDYEDNYYDNYDEYADGELDKSSYTVTNLYGNIKYYPYVEGLEDNFKVSALTEEEKMRLVMATLKSRNVYSNQPATDIKETTITINGKTYTSTIQNTTYSKSAVLTKYTSIFGSSVTYNSNTLMYDGDNIVYKYDESAAVYVKYIAENKSEDPIIDAQLEKAVRKDKKIELYLKTGTKTDIYIFEPVDSQGYSYKLVEKKSVQTKNSL